jgi:RNA polymerase sigma-70 factor (ECF subfamily)
VSDPTDLELLDAWREGDKQAGNTLFLRHAAAITRFFRNKVGVADDLIQGTFLACVEARDRFDGRASFRTYLFAVARNQLYAHLRELRGRTPVDMSCDSIAAITDAASRKLAAAEDFERVRGALRQLPVDQQVLLELHYWESLDAAALAEVFDASAGTIRVRLHRARKALADHLRRPISAVDAEATASRPV